MRLLYSNLAGLGLECRRQLIDASQLSEKKRVHALLAAVWAADDEDIGHKIIAYFVRRMSATMAHPESGARN